MACIVAVISLEFRHHLFKEILATDTKEALTSKANYIRLLKEQKNYGEAEQEILRELRINPDQPSLKTSLADLYLRQGRMAEGRILAEEVLARDPQHPEALSVLGDLFLKQRSPQQALDCYRQASVRDPRPYLVLKTARALKEMRKLDDALQELDKVLVVTPESLPFLKEKAVILNRMKRYDQALDVFNKIRDRAPEDPFVQKEILRLRSRSRSDAQVLNELKAVVGMNSKKGDAQMHGLLAQKLKGAGLVREAAAEYKVASTLEPGNPYFLKQQGFCHYREGSYDEAIQCLAEAFQSDPLDYVVLKTLEKSFEARGRTEAFLALLEEALRKHPEQRPLLGTLRKTRKKLNPERQKDPR